MFKGLKVESFKGWKERCWFFDALILNLQNIPNLQNINQLKGFVIRGISARFYG